MCGGRHKASPAYAATATQNKMSVVQQSCSQRSERVFLSIRKQTMGSGDGSSLRKPECTKSCMGAPIPCARGWPGTYLHTTKKQPRVNNSQAVHLICIPFTHPLCTSCSGVYMCNTHTHTHVQRQGSQHLTCMPSTHPFCMSWSGSNLFNTSKCPYRNWFAG